ncbi:3-oxoacyl-ACP reductase [Weissella cibaria]|uniref:3-oxoacyl-ACP reductase n=1 Tax=Weissella cibaria TaxID=137591 RepID=UPI001CC95229|nr:3-oxoacyl-ACP reductase [Weissella cibaria]MBZ5941156.1 3-oxoacyl-ACP reductase [Weissella cibaria]MCT0953555.1 3-oxoacyl-ACP reductase [Weissella cibaria]
MITQNYERRTILLTGAASGIGFSQMQTYLAAGATVIALDKQVISNDHPHLRAFQLDLADEEQLATWLTTHVKLLEKVDIVLSTAGVLDAFTPALATTYPAIKQLMQVNVYAAVQISLAVLPYMVARQAGTFVFMASIAGQVAGGGGAAYTMSKHALVGWMKQLALDYAGQGIRVNAIAPGAINTPMNAADFAGDGAMAAQVAADTPVKRWADPQEVADLTLYLTSPEATYIQGQVFTIDGGWTIK